MKNKIDEIVQPPQSFYSNPAVWSDARGNLLFYANQNGIWNSRNEMIGDFDYFDNNWNRRSNHGEVQMVVVPKDTARGLYYIFSLSKTWVNGLTSNLYYHVVNMDTLDGKGALVSKNNFVAGNLYSYFRKNSFAAVSAGCKGSWITAVRQTDKKIVSFLVTADSVYKTPVVSDVGIRTEENSVLPLWVAEFKIARSGTVAAIKLLFEQYLGGRSSGSMLMKFNQVTGEFSKIHRIYFFNISNSDYGHEFSPSGKYFYQGGVNFRAVNLPADTLYLRQYDLESSDSLYVVTNYREVTIDSLHKGFYTTLTLNYRNQLMIASSLLPLNQIGGPETGHYSVVEKPDLPCPQCDVQVAKILFPLQPDSANVAEHSFFPIFLRGSLVPDTALQAVTTGCVADSVQPVLTGFQYAPPSYTWHFGNGDSLITSTTTVPAYKYAQPGTYKLSVKSGECRAERIITVHPHPGAPALGHDTTLCDGQTLLLNATPADTFTTVAWNTGSTLPTLPVSTPGSYKATWSNACALTQDSLQVGMLYQPSAPFATDDTILCTPPFVLDAGNPGFVRLWNTQDTTALLPVQEDGIYQVKISNNCFELTDSIRVTRYTRPIGAVDFPDTTLCLGDTLLLTVPYRPFTDYKWYGALPVNDTLLRVSTPGTYQVQISNACEVLESSAQIAVRLPPPGVLPADTIICGAESLRLVAGSSDNVYAWSTGSNDREIEISEDGLYYLITANDCFERKDTISVTFRDRAERPEDTNIITPNGDGVNDRFVPMPVDVEGYSLEIINRWGVQIYRSHNRAQGWEASNATDGTYFYRMTYLNCRGEREEQKGWVEVRR